MDIRQLLAGMTCAIRFGVYDMVSDVLSGAENSHWRITDEMLEAGVHDTAGLSNNADEPDADKDYQSRKNKETLAAEAQHKDAMKRRLSGVSGLVCDLATGEGHMLRTLLAAGGDTRIVCTDIDWRVLAMTRKRLQTDDDKIAYVAADARHMPFADDSFDCVTSYAGFGNIPDSVQVAKELFRILKPGGTLFLQANFIEKGSKSHALTKQYGVETGMVEEAFIQCLEQAGFRRVQSAAVAQAIWAENPYDLLPVAGDTYLYNIVQADK